MDARSRMKGSFKGFRVSEGAYKTFGRFFKLFSYFFIFLFQKIWTRTRPALIQLLRQFWNEARPVFVRIWRKIWP
jgi:hypothetical protein